LINETETGSYLLHPSLLQLHINPDLFDSVAVTPLLRPAAKPHCDVGKTK
jgi:hypothetical protein